MIRKYSFAVPISREMALDFGLVEPTEAERAARDAAVAEWKAKREAAQPRIRESLAALDALDGLERAVLDLHSFDRTRRYVQECEGCDFSGWEGDPPLVPQPVPFGSRRSTGSRSPTPTGTGTSATSSHHRSPTPRTTTPTGDPR